MTSESEKAKLGADSLTAFFDQFGEKDDSFILLLDIFLEELMAANLSNIVGDDAKTVLISSESQQTGDQIGNCAEERVSSNIEISKPGFVEVANDLAKPNPEDCSREQNALRTLGGDSNGVQRSARSFEGQGVYEHPNG